MPGLKRVVQRRCEHRDCERFGMPVDAGDVCPGCKNPLVVRTKFEVWVLMAAGGAVLLITILVILLARPHASPAPSPPAAAVGTTPVSPPAQLTQASSPRQTSAKQEASQAVSLGEKLANRGLYEEARREFLRATLADPESPMAWADLGAAAAVTRRVEEAHDAYKRALDLAPDNWLTHYNLALLLAREGDREGAVHHLEKFSALVGPGDEKRRRAVDDLRRDPALRGLLDDPRLRDLTAQPGGAS